MDRLIEFVTHHWMLVSGFVALLIILIIEEARAKGLGGNGVTPQKLSLLVSHDNAVVIDLRDTNAFKDGHIIGAKNIPFDQLDQNFQKLEIYKDKSLILVCANGQKTPALAAKLSKSGFSNVYLLTNGMAAWRQAGMPVVKK